MVEAGEIDPSRPVSTVVRRRRDAMKISPVAFAGRLGSHVASPKGRLRGNFILKILCLNETESLPGMKPLWA